MSKNKERKVRVIILDIDDFPSDYPFWARLKIAKKRTILIIDRDKVKDKTKDKLVPVLYIEKQLVKIKKEEKNISQS